MINNSNYIFPILLLSLIFYLLFNTGIHGDDYTAFDIAGRSSLLDFLSWTPTARGQNFFGIFNHYFFYWIYEVFDKENTFIFDFLKILINFFSIVLTYSFCTCFLDKNRSLFFAIFSVLSLTHDSTLYWYMTAPYIFTASCIFFSYFLVEKNYIKFGLFFLFISVFLSYSSPPYLFGISIIFLLNRSYKKFFIFILPGFCYLAYYFYFGIFLENEIRINNNLSLYIFVKNFVIQFLSSLESVFGPSLFFKFYYSAINISIISFIIMFIFLFFLYFFIPNSKKYIDHKLLFGLICIYMLSLFMFSLTGLYTQSPFNLGNRVTIYSTLLLSYFLCIFVKNKNFLIFFLFIFLIPIFGLSDHWKQWNINQKIIINNIENNKNLKNIGKDNTLIIVNNLYSKLGIFSHIEFFSMPWVVRSIFRNTTDTKNFMVLSEYSKIYDNKIFDSKFNETIKIENKIFKYDTNTNILTSLDIKQLKQEHLSLNKEYRHWIQFKNNSFINKFIIYLNPRLKMYIDKK
jgi:hypothetical protein|tara:strand:- start:1817 stop:3361 length:1545 start_codon:yes stop_codon:yes gene_type:complete